MFVKSPISQSKSLHVQNIQKKKNDQKAQTWGCWAKHCLSLLTYPPNVQDLQGGE